MSRRKRSENGATPLPAGGVMEVTVKGPAEEVREQMGIQTATEPVPAKEKAADDFVQALNNPKYVVTVKRVMPRAWNGQRCNVEVLREQCPFPMESIEQEIFQNCGGRRYRVAVMDPEGGTTVAARVIENDADPIVPETETDFEREQALLQAAEPSAAEMTEDALNRQAKIAAKQLELEGLQQQLESVRGKKNGKGEDSAVSQQLRAMEKQLLEAQYQAKLEAVQVRLDEMSKKLTEPRQQDQTASELIRLMTQQMQKSDERFQAMMQQMQDSKWLEIQRDLREIKNKPLQENNSLRDSIETLKAVAETLGWNVPGGGDDDEDRPWYEKLAEKYLPKVFELVEERESKGQPMTKEEVIAQMNAAAEKAAREESERIRQRQLAAQPKLQQASIPAAPVTAPPTAPDPVPVPPPQPSPVEHGQDRKIPTVAEEVGIRVANVMTVLDRESMMRPREWQWNYVMWRSLPEDLRLRVGAAADAVAAISCFDGLVNQEGLDQFKKRIQDEPKLAAWLKLGLDELRGWNAELEKDPAFDPAAEEEEEVEA